MADYLKVSILGTMPGGEEWSVNPVYSLPNGAGAITYEELQTLLEDINDLVVPTNLRALFNAVTTVSGARLEVRSTSGTLFLLAEGLKDTPTAGTGAAPHPYQTSCVTSLRSNTPGASGRGRLYWPATGITISPTTLRIADTAQATILDGVSSYLTSIRAEVQALDPASTLVVYSRTKGVLYPIVRLMVGDVLDTQRRRRDAVPESYVTGLFPDIP